METKSQIYQKAQDAENNKTLSDKEVQTYLW